MRIDSSGKYYAESAEEMTLLMEMALQGGGRSPKLSKDNKLSPLEIFGTLSATYPGSSDLFGMNPVDVDLAGASKPGIGAQVKGATGKAAATTKGVLGKALSYVDDLVTPAAKQAQLSLLNRVGGIGAGGAAGPMGAISRFAASPAALTAAKVGTGIGALGGVLGAADVLVGNDSLGNKAMDTVAMGIGGTLGAVGGPLGIAAGAGLGKAASDATQWLFGDKKSAEQRRMEEALALVRGGQI